ncbi:MAG: glycoside hydrolase family 16 protein, partial [Gammaproteobacteria bacterium]|nr:glycoside hydrolase family 16 protein [Gammaproteobacteria bacterium]
MTHFHMDFWTPDPTTEPAAFIVKLIDFGADGAYDGGDDSSHELSFTAANTSGMASETWVSLDIPLSDFAGLTGKGHLAQLVLSSAEGEFPNTVYVDNVFFYDSGDDPVTENGPSSPAPTPTADAASVLSMFSNAYTDATVDTWNTGWQYSTAVVADVQVAGDDVKLYTNLNFVGIEFSTQTLDASAMNRFHMDIWTPDPSVAPAEFKIKLIDFGADGAYNGGDDSEHELSFSASSNPALATESWVSIDVPMSAFSGLSSQAHLAQMVLSSAEAGFPNTVYIDNVYFYDGDDGTATEPSEAAPTPTFSAGDVISLFSDAYTDVAIDTWSADWDSADLTDEQVSGNNVKLYSNLVFAGIEFTSQTINATDMTHFHIDLWTADPTEAPAEFKIKLVDFGDN